MYQLILNLIPQGMLPRINVSQYDHGQVVDVTLYEGSTAYTLPSGATVTVSGTKADNTGFEYNCTTTGGLSFTIADQMTVFAGEVECELTIRYGNNRISTINFILDVERAALQDDVVISETDLPILQQIPEYAAQASADANLAHRWATGGGSDTPSATNNAKYWAQQAAQTDIGRAIAVDYSTDKTPYQFRRCIHNAVYDKLVGISYVKNQLVRNGDFSNGTTGWSGNNATLSASNKVCSFTASAQDGRIQSSSTALIASHKYLSSCEIKASSGNIEFMVTGEVGNNKTITGNGAFQKVAILFTTASSDSVTFPRIYDKRTSGWDTVQVRNVMYIDLTLMFGTAIADKIYAMEQATAGSGLAWIRQYGFLNDTYIEYNAGAIESSAPTVRKVVGFNQLDLSKVTLGKMVNSSGSLNDSNKRSVSDYIKVFPSTQYYLKGVPGDSVYLSTAMFDENKNFISNVSVHGGESASGKITTPSNAWYMRVNLYTPNIDTAIVNISDDSKNGTYEPYKEVIYPLGGDTLQGVPKLVGNDLVSDGDVKTSDGVVNTAWRLLDLGTINWVKDGSSARFLSNDIKTLVKAPASNTYLANVLCSKYIVVTMINADAGTNDKVIAISSSGVIRIVDSAYLSGTAEQFKAAMSGVYLLYPLATSTSSVSTPFTSPQVSLETEETDTICGHDSVVVDIPEWMQNEYFDDVRADASKVQGIERGLGKIECDKTAAGTYTLSCTIDGSGTKTYSWA